jgi:ubiquinone/menaquinone biosynthesis C-methylase UbiE
VKRIPEPEAMDTGEEVEAYASAAAQAHLRRLDFGFVNHVLRLGVRGGMALDLGAGPAQIPIAILQRLPDLRYVVVDCAQTMLAEALKNAEAAGVADRFTALAQNACALDYPDGSFDFVGCNSLLHHVRDPLALLREMARLLRPGGAFLLRDLRRPSWLALPWHAGWHGRHYSGKMRELFRASVLAAYTGYELQQFAAALIAENPRMAGLRLFRIGGSHIGLERPLTAHRSQPTLHATITAP